MTRRFRPHPVVWFHGWMRTWWPLFVSAAAVVLIATMGWVAWTVVDERRYFEQEQARDRRQDAQLQELLEHQRHADAQREERLEQAISEVEQLLAGQFAEHDLNVATKLNDLLAQIAALVGRPAGVVSDPVAARDVDGTPATTTTTRPARDPRPPPTTTTAPTTTTTTSPGGSSLCDRLPSTPICRRSR